jgi:hypothetical protein
VVSFTPRLLYPRGKSPWYPLDRRLGGGAQSRSGHSGEEKNSQPLQGLEPPIIQPVAQRYTTQLSRLLKDKTGEDEKKSEVSTVMRIQGRNKYATFHFCNFPSPFRFRVLAFHSPSELHVTLGRNGIRNRSLKTSTCSEGKFTL